MVFDNTVVNMVKQKLVVVGDIAVGKTTIINSLLGQKFKDNYEPSVGVDFFTKNIKFKGKNIKLQIWDSAGQEKYRSLIKNYIRGSSIIFIIYDIASKLKLYKFKLDKNSFENVNHWLKFIRDIENCLVVICGNKLDLNENRLVFIIDIKKGGHFRRGKIS
jgi:small GTP-binding protein